MKKTTSSTHFIRLSIVLFILFISSETSSGQNMIPIHPSSDNPGYKAISIVFTGLNATLTTFNIIHFNKGGKSKYNAGFAILTGLTQVVVGGFMKGEGNTGLEIMNYSVGTATAIIGGIRLFKKEKKHLDITMYPYTVPVKNGIIIGMTLALK